MTILQRKTFNPHAHLAALVVTVTVHSTKAAGGDESDQCSVTVICSDPRWMEPPRSCTGFIVANQ